MLMVSGEGKQYIGGKYPIARTWNKELLQFELDEQSRRGDRLLFDRDYGKMGIKESLCSNSAFLHFFLQFLLEPQIGYSFSGNSFCLGNTLKFLGYPGIYPYEIMPSL